MKVKDLIKKLSEWDSELPVCYVREDGKVSEISDCEAYKEDDSKEFPDGYVVLK